MSDDAIPNNFNLRYEVGQLFTPATPINEKELFAGRSSQVRRVLDTISQRGQHAIIFGERGVGKTSLANVLSSYLEGTGRVVIVPRVACSSSDSFTDVWRRILTQVRFSRQFESMGLRPEVTTDLTTLADNLPDRLTPDIIRELLAQVGQTCLLVLIVDEFDRLTQPLDARLFADTIKALSDYAVPATIVLVGVADSVDSLIAGHESVLRNLVQIPIPRMPPEELNSIVLGRLPKLGMTIADLALAKITALSRGLPHYSHLIGQHAAWKAIDEQQTVITETHVSKAMQSAIENAQQSIQKAYHQATMSPQKGNLYPQVLLACAIAKCDEFGYFSAADLRVPLQKITGREYDIPSFSRHLKAFSSESRGTILQEIGDKYQRRFRFADPLMQPYVTIRGVAEGFINLPEV